MASRTETALAELNQDQVDAVSGGIILPLPMPMIGWRLARAILGKG